MFQPVIKWSGSKRSQAFEIIKEFPSFNRYYEPFVGGGSILYALNPKDSTCSDICKPLIELWQLIQTDPNKLTNIYENHWQRLQNEGYEVYYEIRDRFNSLQLPEDLFFLSRTCVNGLIRFNQQGKFNNSLHHTRKGINPDRAKKIVFDWHRRIQNVDFLVSDYRAITKTATCDDFIYLDPPYFNTNGRYYGRINYEDFIEYLEELNERNIKFALSYDGIREEKNYVKDLPDHIYKRHFFIESGNSSFRKVMNKKPEMVKESLYLNW